MSGFDVRATRHFARQLKPLAKKYPSLVDELRRLQFSLASNPQQGTPLGLSAFKIRLAIRSKGKGKRGGARVITYVAIVRQQVVLLTIYDKAAQADLPLGELSTLIQQAIIELS